MTGRTYDIDKFRKLLKKAIGDRKQKEFAEIAGLSYFNLNRMLKNDSNGVPKRSSLEKIAEASEGRVTVSQLLYVCGYKLNDIPVSSSEVRFLPEMQRMVKQDVPLLQGGLKMPSKNSAVPPRNTGLLRRFLRLQRI